MNEIQVWVLHPYEFLFSFFHFSVELVGLHELEPEKPAPSIRYVEADDVLVAECILANNSL